MSKINRNTGNLLTCIFEVLVGILLLINPVGFTSGIIIVFGIILAVTGVVSLFNYFREVLNSIFISFYMNTSFETSSSCCIHS